MTRELPILFSAPMVRANLADLKTETRRLRGLKEINEAPGEWKIESTDAEVAILLNRVTGELRTLRCPYGAAGTRLWVRETLEVVANWGTVGYAADRTTFYDPEVNPENEKADALVERWGDSYFSNEAQKIPSIFMPRWASRLTLEVIAWRLERVMQISEAGCLREGLRYDSTRDPHARPQVACRWVSAVNPDQSWNSGVGAYRELWDHLNGKAERTAWAANPWVWVIQYRRCAQ